jgi:ABC-type transport system involved in multi-copper enzyme maturation permease subunit
MSRRLLAIAGSVFMDAVRKRVVLLVGFFGFVMAVAIPSLPSYGLGIVVGVYREISLALTFAASGAPANRVPGEMERRTVYNVLAKPVHRLEYLVGTWAGIFGVLGAVIAGFTLVEQVIGYVQYGDPMWRLWQGALAIWLETGVLAAVAVAVSAMAGPVVVVVATATVLFAGHARDGLLGADSSGLARTLYPSLDTFNVINQVAHGTGIDPAYVGAMALAFVGWVGVVLLLGVAAFGRRDL